MWTSELKDKNNLLPTSRSILISAGDFRFLLEFFVVMFFVTYSPYPYYASLSAGLTIPIYLFFIPRLSKGINRLKSPLNRILLPFVFASLLVCPLFVWIFKIDTTSAITQKVLTLIFMPFFTLFMSLLGRVSGRIGNALNGDAVYKVARMGIQIVVIAVLFALSYLFVGNIEEFACLVAILTEIGFFTQYMSVHAFSSRFKPEAKLVYPKDWLEFFKVVSLMAVGVIGVNLALYYYAFTDRLIYSVVVGICAVVISGQEHFLKSRQHFLVTEMGTRISTLLGILISGLILSLKGVKKVLGVGIIVIVILLIIAIVLFVITLKRYKKNQGEVITDD